MIIANKYEIPDNCPPDCNLGPNEPFNQGHICCSCPVFNCRGVPAPPEYADEDGMFRMMRPEDFREDWAKEWSEFFKTGRMPELYLAPPEK